MLGILPLLSGQCSSLRSFHHGKPGWTNHRTELGMRSDGPCYAENSDFILSVSATLENFHFEHGTPERQISLYKIGQLERDIGPPFQKAMPME